MEGHNFSLVQKKKLHSTASMTLPLFCEGKQMKSEVQQDLLAGNLEPCSIQSFSSHDWTHLFYGSECLGCGFFFPFEMEWGNIWNCELGNHFPISFCPGWDWWATFSCSDSSGLTQPTIVPVLSDFLSQLELLLSCSFVTTRPSLQLSASCSLMQPWLNTQAGT